MVTFAHDRRRVDVHGVLLLYRLEVSTLAQLGRVVEVARCESFTDSVYVLHLVHRHLSDIVETVSIGFNTGTYWDFGLEF